MFDIGTLSMDNPLALQRLVYFFIAFFLCRRDRENLGELKISDFVLRNDGGRKYLTLRHNEHLKNHPGHLRPACRFELIMNKQRFKQMKDISTAAGLSKPYTNHSVRVTAIQVLDEAAFETRVIMSISGHKNDPLRKAARRVCDKDSSPDGSSPQEM
ncbi:uncharacterized protein [Branchiostoma lanceolatum]|uniref:uncharacterized protein n=1 Tax=Branchiostoma lanceolatum TaxID=7740 RepID=UPI00345590D1